MDIIFAAEDAQFLGSNFQFFSVPWDIGIRKAKEILFEPRFITAREAQDLGFVNRVLASQEEAEEEALAYAHRVAANSLFNLRMTKVNINMAQDMQGYTNHIMAAHTKPGGGSNRGAQLPSGGRRVAPIPIAEENLRKTKGIN